MDPERISVDFTMAELSGLIDMEEEALATHETWEIGQPNPWTETATEKIRGAFRSLYDAGHRT